MSGAVQPGGCWEARVASAGWRRVRMVPSPPAPAPKKRLAEQALFQGSGLARTSGASEHVSGRLRRRFEASMRPFCNRGNSHPTWLCLGKTPARARGDESRRQGVSIGPRQQLFCEGHNPATPADRKTI